MKPCLKHEAGHFFTAALISGATLEEIEGRAKKVQESSRAATAWFRRHVAAYCAQMRRSRAHQAEAAALHAARLSGMPLVDGCRAERGRFGANNKNAWRVWLPDGEHVLVYMNGRAGLTAEQAVSEALATRASAHR